MSPSMQNYTITAVSTSSVLNLWPVIIMWSWYQKWWYSHSAIIALRSNSISIWWWFVLMILNVTIWIKDRISQSNGWAINFINYILNSEAVYWQRFCTSCIGLAQGHGFFGLRFGTIVWPLMAYLVTEHASKIILVILDAFSILLLKIFNKVKYGVQMYLTV